MKSASNRSRVRTGSALAQPLRAGFATSAAAAGKSLHNIMRQTRHKDERVAMTYIRHGSLFDSNATEGLGDDADE